MFTLRYIIIFLAIAGLTGCGKPDDKTIAKVNGSKITVGEFKFIIQGLSRGGRAPVSDQMKNRVVDQLITKALLLEEADRLGLTNDPALLRRIEQERERIILNELTRREIDMFITATDEDLKQYYEAAFKQQKGKNVPPFESVKDQIRKQWIAQKRQETFKKLVENLRSKATIKIDEETLKAALASMPMPAAPPPAAQPPTAP